MEKNILFCINSLKIGGAEKLLVDLINNWPVEFNIYLVLFSEDSQLLPEISRTTQVIKIESKNNISRIVELSKIFKKNNIDFCFSHLERPNKVALFASLFSKTVAFPVVHSVNMYKNERNKEIVASFIYKYFATKVIVISATVQEYIRDTLKINNVVLIENGLDFNRVNLSNNETKVNSTNFFTLGRLVWAKGYDFMIRALNNDEILKYEWHLTIIGDGDKKSEIINLINENNLQSKITLLGSQNNPFEYITKNSIALMPSRREGLPIALLEILSQGIPVISSNIDSLTHLIKNGINGYIFKRENPKDFQRVFLQTLIASDKQINSMSKNATKSVINYNIKNCVNNYLNILK